MKSRIVSCLFAVVVTASVGYAWSPAGAQPAAPRARIVQDLRLDANAENFSALRNVTVGPRGQLVVLLPQDFEARMYDSTGKRIAAIGRRGSGPGEFQSLTNAGWVGDTLWIHDGSIRRTTFITPDGKVVRAVTTPAPLTVAPVPPNGAATTLASILPLAVHSDGAMTGDAFLMHRGETGRPVVTHVIARTSLSGNSRIVVRPSYEDPRWWFRMPEGAEFDVPFTFPPEVVLSPDGGRMAMLTAGTTAKDSGVFTVSLFKANGDTLFVKSFPFRGAPVAQKAIDSALANLVPPGAPGTRGARVGAVGGADFPQRVQAIARQQIPSVYAPVQAIVLGLDNTVWITLRATAEGTVVLMLDERGTPAATMLLPSHSVLRQASARRVWVTETDSDGLTSIVRYRVAGIP